MPDDASIKTAPKVQLRGRSKGERTRDRVMDLAYNSMVTKGFAATSIDELVEAAGLTKSGFFYHFKDKHDLARQVLARYRERNNTLLESISARARELSDDPLHGFLIFLRLYAEETAANAPDIPGCLVATITYQERSFAHDVRQANVDMLLDWRAHFRGWLEAIVLDRRPNEAPDLEALTDAAWSTVLGAFTVAKTLGRLEIISQQILLYRETIRRTFPDRA
jgi:TetR/AcrR family transcriptional regulator, transcriptional repressor for nem operon